MCVCVCVCVCGGGGGGMVENYCPGPGWAYYNFNSGESVRGYGNG